MDSRIISIDSRDMIPLATSAELEDQSVKNFSGIFTLSASLFGRIILVNQFRDAFPKVIRNFPNRWYAFMLRHILYPPSDVGTLWVNPSYFSKRNFLNLLGNTFGGKIMLTWKRTRTISALAFPAGIALGMTLMMSLVDLAMVGRLGNYAVAAV